MLVKLEYEHEKYIELEIHDVNYFLGPDHTKKWKLYRGIKRFSTGKTLSELEEHVYGDDGIVIFCDDKKMKAKELPIYYLDCRESFLQQYQNGKRSLMNNEIQAIEETFEIHRGIEKINNKLLLFENQLSELFAEKFTHVQPTLRSINYNDIIKYFFHLSFFENNDTFPLEMMDIERLIDDYCQLLINEIRRTQKMSWLWINNPNAFMSKSIFCTFVDKLKEIAYETNLLKIFILSEDYLSLNYKGIDVESTVLLYEDQQQLPPFSIFKSSIQKHYPDEFVQNDEKIISSLFRIFPYVCKNWERAENVYLRDKDVVLLKVVDKLLGYKQFGKYQCEYATLTELEKKFLVDSVQKSKIETSI